MAISPQLRQFKSSGVYRLEFDKSQTSNIDVSTLRLMVGHSKKGPYNSPILIENVEDFKNVFGDIDKSLEKKGMYFHRSCLAALSRGPILCLNLTTFTAATAELIKPYTDGGASQSSNLTTDIDINSTPYTSFHNIEKFMTPSDTSFLGITNSTGDDNIIAFTNLKSTPITVIIRAAEDIDGFEISADEWYGNGNVPAYLHDKDYLSDFMVDIFIFKGKFDHVALQNDATFGNYFDANGLIKSKLDEFSNLRTVTTLAKYTGSLLPGFKDMEGRSLYIESMVNAEARRTGLFCAVDEDRVLNENGTKLDLIGHNGYALNSNPSTATLSYPVSARTQSSSGDIVENSENITGNVLTVAFDNSGGGVPADAIAWPTSFVQKGDYLWAAEANRLAKVKNVVYTDNSATRTYSITTDVPVHADVISDTTTAPINYTASTLAFALGAGDTTYFIADATGWPSTGTLNYTDTAGAAQTPAYSALVDKTAVITSAVATGVTLNQGGAYDATAGSLADMTLAGTLTAWPAKGKVTIGGETLTYSNINGQVLTIDSASPGTTAAIADGTAVTSFQGHWEATAAAATVTAAGVAIDAADGTDTSVAVTVKWIQTFEKTATSYVPFYIAGATLDEPTISECVGQLSGTGLAGALADKDMIDFRYLVDTFGSLDTVNGIITKSEITKLAKDRQNASAIMNAPTVDEFKASSDPKFTDNGVFDTKYIKDGGNLDLNPTSLYTLPGINDGANHAFYYAPGLLVKDSGKNIIVPPAGYVSNNYIDKYTAALPWSIVAGPRRGVVGGSGLIGAEYTFDKDDRDILEPFGINPIVFQRGVGLTILGNKTAQQSIKSALSSAHVREVLIYIADGIADILKDYVFEFNTVQTRLEIKTLVDAFLESVKQDKGVYDYKNIMDSSNNDNEVIDNNMGIVDTYVEPVKGLEIVVHRTTVLNTGEIATGSFL